MKMLFRQRMFTWFDSYDIYDEGGNTIFRVEGKFSWGHKLIIYDAYDREVGMVQQEVLTLMPAFELYADGRLLGKLRREFTFFVPNYRFDYNGWHAEGSVMEWDYRITDGIGQMVATVSKELFHLTDTYTIDVADPEDALTALMFVLAVDAEKCSRN